MRRAALLGLLAAVVAAAPAQALPELAITMPSEPYAGQVSPVYVDAFQEQGKLLYRFDALIHNDGTTLDLYRDTDGSVHQVLWPGGSPPWRRERTSGRRRACRRGGPPGRGDRVRPGGDALALPLLHGGALRAAGGRGGAAGVGQDRLLHVRLVRPPGRDGRVGLPPDQRWCHEAAAASDPGFVRMGLSAGAADRYSSQREFQYVDVTGLAPGPYRLRGITNPEGDVLEADGEPDVTEETRTVPGVVAEPAALTAAPGAPAAVDVRARAVAPEIPARRAASCRPSATVDACYERITAATPLTYAVASGPEHGAASFDGARLTYAPANGFTGSDRLTYTATDGRGLVSAPAAVAVQVDALPDPSDPGLGPAGKRRLLRIGRVRRAGRRTLAVRLHCRPAAVARCAGRIEARLAGRRVGAERFANLAPGRRRTVVLRVRPAPSDPQRRLVLRATVRDGRGAGVTARRVVTR